MNDHTTQPIDSQPSSEAPQSPCPCKDERQPVSANIYVRFEVAGANNPVLSNKLAAFVNQLETLADAHNLTFRAFEMNKWN